MILIEIFYIPAIILSFTIVFYLLKRKNKKAFERIFFIQSVLIISWPILLYSFNHDIGGLSFLWIRLVFVVSIIYQYFIFLFFRHFPKKWDIWQISLLNFFLILTSIYGIYLLLFSSDIVVSTFLNEKGVVLAELGYKYSIFGGISGLMAMSGLILGFLNVGFSKGYQKIQHKYYLTGVIISGIIIMFFVSMLPTITGSTYSFIYAPVGTIPYFIFFYYAMSKYRLFDVKYITRKFLEYIFLSFWVFLAILGFMHANKYLNLSSVYNLDSYFLIIVVSLIIVFIILSLSSYIKRYLQREEELRKEYLSRYSKEIRKLVNFEDMNKLTYLYLVKLLNIQEINICITKKEVNGLESFFEGKSDYLTQDKTVGYSDLLRRMNLDDGYSVFIQDELLRRYDGQTLSPEEITILNNMKLSNIGVLVYMDLSGEYDALLIISSNNKAVLFSVEESDTIEAIVSNVIPAYGRALIYKRTDELNKNLQRKVTDQTKELQIKIEQLEESRRKERDMIDIMGHELRTPATIVKLNAELLEKYVGSNPENFKKYLGRIRGSIENEIKLINKLLSSAKLEGNRIAINNEDVNIKDEIEMVMHGYESIAKEKGIALVNKVLPTTPNVYGDKVRIIEVLDNLIGNAVKYTKAGSVSVESVFDDSNVKVSIIDTGEGISEEDVSRLGNKFYRVNNYLDSEIVRPGGTGLGLYVVFNLVRLMKGKIWVESKVGEGSKFMFTLPVFSGQRISSQDTGSKNMFERLGLRR